MGSYTVIGHVAIDRIIRKDGDRTQLGGPPTYVNLVAKKTGEIIHTVTKVGDGIPKKLISKLTELGLDIRNNIVEGAETTRFILDYRGINRKLSVESICEEIRPENVIDHNDAVLISPIIGEIPKITNSAIEAELLALDPQGYIREVTSNKDIILSNWSDDDLLTRINIFKSTEEELEYIFPAKKVMKGIDKIIEKGAEITIITQGEKGAILALNQQKYRIPAYIKSRVVDPTGAGDAFLGMFFSLYLKGKDLIWSASMANSIASHLVETNGPKINTSLKNIEERAEKIYENTEKL